MEGVPFNNSLNTIPILLVALVTYSDHPDHNQRGLRWPNRPYSNALCATSPDGVHSQASVLGFHGFSLKPDSPFSKTSF